MIKRIIELVKTNKSLSLISSGSGAVMGVLSFALLARSISKEELGQWVVLITVFTLFDMLRSGFLNNGLIKKIADAGTEVKEARYIGSAWRLNIQISVYATLVITIIFGFIYFLNPSESVLFVLRWFGILCLISVPHSIATWVSNAYLSLNRIFWIRFTLQGVFLLGVAYNFYNPIGLSFVVFAYLSANILTAFLVLGLNWGKQQYISYAQRAERNELVQFGKFTMGTSIGSNLLRSSDTFLISAFLGPIPVAIYTVPERLIGLFDIPLRSLMSVFFPSMAKKHATSKIDEFKEEFHMGVGFATILLFPICILSFIFAEDLVVLLAGDEYASAAWILRIFSIYTLLTPLDRFCGVALDVLNMPEKNFQKVIYMLAANIVGDLIVLFFTDSLYLVALVSIGTFFTGIVFGIYYLRKDLPISLNQALLLGLGEYKRLYLKYIN